MDKTETLQPVLQAACLIDEMKGVDVTVLDISKLCSFTDYFVIGTGTSSSQLRALSSRVERTMREQGCKAIGASGGDSESWIVLDFGDFLVHLMSEEARDHYRLEALWQDADIVNWQEHKQANNTEEEREEA